MKKLLLTALAIVAPLAGYAGNYTFTDNTDFNSLAHGTAYTWGLSGTTYNSLLSSVQSGQNITSASLTISNIYDWQVEPNDVLYVNILGGINAGASSYAWSTPSSTPDTTYGADPFVYNSTPGSDYALTKPHLTFSDAATNSLLQYGQGGSYYNVVGTPGTWTDPRAGTNGTAETANGFNLTVNFSAANLTLLKSLLTADTNGSTNPDVGLGFGPDCHYFDSGVTLTVTTAASVPDSGGTLALLGVSLLGLAGLRRRMSKSSVAA
jgi:hypothetical protein